MSKTIARHIRIDADDWRRIEALANERRTTPNQLLVELAVEALEHREWPQNPLEIQMLRSCLFTAQATARDMIASGREAEIEEIRREVSQIAPELPSPDFSPIDHLEKVPSANSVMHHSDGIKNVSPSFRLTTEDHIPALNRPSRHNISLTNSSITPQL